LLRHREKKQKNCRNSISNIITEHEVSTGGCALLFPFSDAKICERTKGCRTLFPASSKDREIENMTARKLVIGSALVLGTAFMTAMSASAAPLPHGHYAQHRNWNGDRGLYNYTGSKGDPDARATQPSDNPVDNPSLTGGGSMGYNKCGGHPAC
jgi:hypothetical protein